MSDVPENDEWLSDREREILAGLHVPKRRNDWRLGRWTAKRACRSFDPGLFTAMPQCEILAAADGGPDVYLAGGGPAPLSISISHSHARSFCTIAGDRRPVGCDLERIEMKSLDFFEDYFTPEEIDFCRLASPDAYPIACYLVWCAKESCLKILREGLRRDTRSIRIEAEFSSEKGSWNRWTGHCSITSKIFHGWWRHRDGFVYTLGSDQPVSIPKSFRNADYGTDFEPQAEPKA